MNKGTIRWFNLVIILLILLVYEGVTSARADGEKQQLISELKSVRPAAHQKSNKTVTGPATENTDQTAEQEASAYKNGTFEGEGDGFGGKIKVSVTINNDTIQSVKVIDHSGEGESYYSQASVLTDQIVENQSTDLDTISGATFSSNGILSAVDDALQKAQK